MLNFQNTDKKLQLWLNEDPEIYIQMILLPDGATSDDSQSGLMNIHESYRKQLWQTMVARWAAFPNVFWTVENDNDDTLPKALPLGKELSCYFSASPAIDGVCTENIGADPWRQNRPFGFGHVRGVSDAMRNEPWLSYITAYGAADVSAQQMDGSLSFWESSNPIPTPSLNDLHPYSYATHINPVLYTEDIYEDNRNGDGSLASVQIARPDDFYRRLFWSYLLSGSGVTYGAGSTWLGLTTYPTPLPGGVLLKGLTDIPQIVNVLARERVDLNLFGPEDGLAKNSLTDEINRDQIAVRAGTEMLVYHPRGNTDTAWKMWNRLQIQSQSGRASFRVDRSGLSSGTYQVSWYHASDLSLAAPETKTISITNTDQTILLNPPIGFTNDVIAHLSSHCMSPNVCEPMDSTPPTHNTTASNGINFYANGSTDYAEPVTLTLDLDQYAVGADLA